MDEWQKWFDEQVKRSTMKVKQIPLTQVGLPWGMQPDGNYGRSDGAFFQIPGVEIQANREVPSWPQPIVKEVGEGAIVLAINENGEVVVTAKQEPGNPSHLGHTLLAPTVQASLSNLQQAHGGRKPPYAELLNGREKSVVLPQDGGRFLEKQNAYFVKTVGTDEIELLPNATVITMKNLATAILGGCANEHLIQAFALLQAQKILGK